MSGWTKGPWRVDQTATLISVNPENAAYGKSVCYLSKRTSDDGVRQQFANAHLIAASPLLYEALEGLVDAEWMVTHDWGGDRPKVLDQADAALAKARGET